MVTDTRTAQDRAREEAAADAFFARAYSPEEIARLQSRPTVVELARWERDCTRARTLYAAQVADADAAERHAINVQAGRRGAQNRRERLEREQRMQQRRGARNARNRAWYAENKEKHAEYQRRTRERARENDPERYRAMVNARDRRWYARHREQLREKKRDAYQADPAKVAVDSARNYEKRKEIIKAQHKARYWANHEESLAKQRRYRAREKRRRDLGLPVRATHHTPPEQRRTNDQSAHAFFTRERTTKQILTLREERPGLLQMADPDEWQTSRFRVENTIAALRPHLSSRRERADARHVAKLVLAYEEQLIKDAQAAEDARMDAIARQINTRLRKPQPRARHHNDPAAPHTIPGTHGGTGLSR